jgi:hypothetical protein
VFPVRTFLFFWKHFNKKNVVIINHDHPAIFCSSHKMYNVDATYSIAENIAQKTPTFLLNVGVCNIDIEIYQLHGNSVEYEYIQPFLRVVT